MFQVDVTLNVQLTLSGASADDVIGRARDLMTARPGVRGETIAAIYAMPVPAGFDLREANLAYWQESEAIEHGSPAQRDQWARGELPASELCDIARGVLFAPLRKFKRRVRMGASSIPHPTNDGGGWACASEALADSRHREPMVVPITWTTTPCTNPASWELVVLLQISQAALEIANHPWLGHLPDGRVIVSVRNHTGTCQCCGESASETSALVTVPWANWTLSREYAL